MSDLVYYVDIFYTFEDYSRWTKLKKDNVNLPPPVTLNLGHVMKHAVERAKSAVFHGNAYYARVRTNEGSRVFSVTRTEEHWSKSFKARTYRP